MCIPMGNILPGFVYVVDDDAAFRAAIECCLKMAGYEVASYASAENFLANLPSENELGCVLLDVRMPGLSGPELQGHLRELGSTLPIVFLTGQSDVPTTVRTIKAGAEDFLIKPISSDQLLPAVDRAVTRHEILRGKKAKLDVVCARIARLTPREREVFELITRGQTNKQAGMPWAAQSARSRRTVKGDGKNASLDPWRNWCPCWGVGVASIAGQPA